MPFFNGNRQESCLWAETAAITFDVLDGSMFQIGNTRKQHLHVRYETASAVSRIAYYSSRHKTAIAHASILTLDKTRKQIYGFI